MAKWMSSGKKQNIMEERPEAEDEDEDGHGARRV